MSYSLCQSHIPTTKLTKRPCFRKSLLKILSIYYCYKFVDDIKKTVVAFANSDGGTLYIGINDDGTVNQISDTDACILKVTNTIRDSVKPDVSMFCQVSTVDVDGKPVVRVEVQRGTARPYYIAGKGIRPE